MPLPFFIVDVFAEEKYAGNQLAVFPDAGHLTAAQMQRLAKEINYSETTFILSSTPQNGCYAVRIFTPAQELPFAGHPTLGTAYILQQQVIQQPLAIVTLNLSVGPIPVQVQYQTAAPGQVDVLWMRQNPATFGAVIEAEAIAPLLNLTVEECDRAFPIQDVSTGVPFLIIPLTTLAALQRIRVDVDRLAALLAPYPAQQILAFCPQTRHPANHLSVRVFAHALGIPEDPATGSANGCLAAYLAHYRYFGQPTLNIRVEQGYEIDRPSLLLLQADATTQAVTIGGRVIPIAQGHFL
jgi:trans-2,3-dihydro-3-hydroxyanthranilate isomerase